jgi:hypothetical protein
MTRTIGRRAPRSAMAPVWRVVRVALCAAALAAVATVPAVGTAQAAGGTPCGISDGACVALGSKGFSGTAWLVRGGRIARGPVSALTGGPGEDTPTGSYKVLSKDLHHVSSATTNAKGQPSPMPYAVFFTPSGVAFHGTQPGENTDNRTAGCVRLANGDASYFFQHLSIGDSVKVVQGSGSYGSSSGDSGGHDHGGHGHGGGGGILGGL